MNGKAINSKPAVIGSTPDALHPLHFTKEHVILLTIEIFPKKRAPEGQKGCKYENETGF